MKRSSNSYLMMRNRLEENRNEARNKLRISNNDVNGSSRRSADAGRSISAVSGTDDSFFVSSTTKRNALGV